jgi:signal transduction histidine kinase
MTAKLPPPTRGTGADSAGHALLDRQLAWMVRLRWLAALGVIAGGFLEGFFLRWYGTGLWIAIARALLLLANILFWFALPPTEEDDPARPPLPPRVPFSQRKPRLYALAWAQILSDLLCLTALVALTDGINSPVRGFFVFHMVFASLLLPTAMAFGVAFFAIALVETALFLQEGPQRTPPVLAISLGWDLTLLTTVYLASKITGRIRRQRRRLLRQNARIRRLAEQLHRQQASLVQQEKMVTMGQMAAGVAHEVANPLASMDGLLQLMERRPDRVTAENLARLREQILRINGIVRQLTTLAHPRTQGGTGPGGAATEEFVQGNLNVILTRALEVLRFDQRLKRIVVHRHLDEALPSLRMQPDALEQVMMNLIINAVDAMENVATPTLTITTTRLVPAALPAAGAAASASPPPGVSMQVPAVELRIQDNGIGVPPELRERLFEPFFTTKPVGKGTGLGLSISLTVIRRHEGTITLQSPPPGAPTGTVFIIRLPATG